MNGTQLKKSYKISFTFKNLLIDVRYFTYKAQRGFLKEGQKVHLQLLWFDVTSVFKWLVIQGRVVAALGKEQVISKKTIS